MTAREDFDRLNREIERDRRLEDAILDAKVRLTAKIATLRLALAVAVLTIDEKDERIAA